MPVKLFRKCTVADGNTSAARAKKTDRPRGTRSGSGKTVRSSLDRERVEPIEEGIRVDRHRVFELALPQAGFVLGNCPRQSYCRIPVRAQDLIGIAGRRLTAACCL